MPVGAAYDSICSSCTWQEFLSPKGIQVIQVSGNLTDETIRTKILIDKWNTGEICSKLSLVAKFLEAHDSWVVNSESFHTACLNPDENTKIVNLEGFSDAAAQYISANQQHFGATVQFKTQFAMLVKRNTSISMASMLSDTTGPFRVGFSSVIFSSGPYANEELKYTELTEVIREN